MPDQLTVKQLKFVAAYIGEANGNASEAARIAGYRVPMQQGYENLRKPEIAAAIAEHRTAIKAEGIANRQNRIERLNRDWQRMQQIVEERAAAATRAHELAMAAAAAALPEDGTVPPRPEQPGPGATSGHLARQEKNIGGGLYGRYVAEYVFDEAILRELRAHEKQAAQELGEWSEKQELTGKDGAELAGPLVKVYLPQNGRDRDGGQAT